MPETKQWRWRWPLTLNESRIRGIGEHLRIKHKTVKVAAGDKIGVREDVDLESFLTGHLWVRTKWVRFDCADPKLILFIQDVAGDTAEIQWEAAAEESASFLSAYVRNCFAALQIPCHTVLFISLPILLNGVFAVMKLSAGQTPSAPSTSGTTVPSAFGWLGWALPVAAIVVTILACFLLGKLRSVRAALGFLIDQYSLLFPGTYFALPWSSQYSDGARWIGITLYSTLLYWMLAS